MSEAVKEELEKEVKKSEKSKENETILYDADAVQTIPLEITKGIKTYDVAHVLRPLSDERFFRLDAEVLETSRRSETLSSQIYEPKQNLWRELAEKRVGYAENPNWREKTHQSDTVQAISALLFSEAVKASDTIEDELLNDDELTPVHLKCRFNSGFVETVHNFREETKDEFDIFFSIITGSPRKDKLASAKKRNPAREFAELYDVVCVSAEGYARRVPAWHKMVAARAFFEGQFTRLGKS